MTDQHADAGEDTLAEFERFTVNRSRLTVEQTVNACFVTADRARLYEEFRERIEQRTREQVAAEIMAKADALGPTLVGPRASFRRGLEAAARHILPPPTPQEIADAINRGDAVFCNPEETDR